MEKAPEKKQRVLFVIREFYPFRRPSGVISLIREFTQAFDQTLCEPVILTIQKRGENKKYMYQGVSIYKFNQLNLFEYRNTVKKINPHAIVFISSMTSTLHILLWWGPLRLCTPGKNIFFYQLTNPFSLKYNSLMQQFLQSFKKIFVTSIYIKTLFQENFNQRTNLILPGLNLENLVPFQKRHQKIRRIGFFGHFVHIKGFDHFIQLAEDHPEVEFYLVAGNPKKSSMEEKNAIAALDDLDNVIFHGYVDDPLSLMAECDLLVLPYRSGATVLGVAQSAIEAMGMGIPVIGTKNSALDSLIISNENGFLCKSIDEISQKVNLLKGDIALYNRLSKNARTTVEKKHNIQQIVDKFIQHII